MPVTQVEAGGFSGASVARTTDQAVGGGGSAVVTWETDSLNGCFDIGDYWSGGAPTRLTVPVTGKYLVSYAIARTTAGELAVTIRANNDSAQSYGVSYVTGFGFNLSGSSVIHLAGAGFIEIVAFSTTAYTLDGTSNNRTRTQIAKL